MLFLIRSCFFQDEFPDICEDAFTFGIVRNPYDKFVSGFSYHPYCRDFSMTEILSKLPTPPILPKYVRWKEHYPKRMWELFSAYNHISQPQSDPLIKDLRFPINKLLKFEKIDGEVLGLAKDLSIGNPSQFTHRKRNTNRSHYSKCLNEDSVKLINKHFSSDFLFFGYDFLCFI